MEEGKTKSPNKIWVVIAFILFIAVVILSYMVVQNKLQPQGQVVKEIIKEVPVKIGSYNVEGFVDKNLDAILNEEPISASEIEIILSQEEISLD
jgi:hypothetical protein